MILSQSISNLFTNLESLSIDLSYNSIDDNLIISFYEICVSKMINLTFFELTLYSINNIGKLSILNLE